MPANQLSLYNGALRLCGQTQLQFLTDDVEARLLLDGVWGDGSGVINGCLEQGYWYFAKRTSALTYDTSITPNFGFQCAFEKPGDWVRTMAVCQDPDFEMPLTRMIDEAGYLYSDLQTIYFAYVSNGARYGGNMNLWPQTFVLAVEGYLAALVVRALTAGDETKIASVMKEAKRLMTDARSKVAMNESASFFPIKGRGCATASATGPHSDRGNQNSLYG